MQLILRPEQIAHPNGLSVSIEGFQGDIGHKVPSQLFVEGDLRIHVWDGGEDPVFSTSIPRV
jgi:hypothetical protein